MIRPIQEFSSTLGSLAEFLGIPKPNHPETRFTGVSSDTRELEPGDLFFDLPSLTSLSASSTNLGGISRDDRIAEAISRGAVAVVSDAERELLIPSMAIPSLRNHIGETAAWFYHHPSRALDVYGITGTNGKTTVTTLLNQIWRYDCRATSLIGTTGIDLGGESLPAQFTTPLAYQLQSLLAVASERHIRNVAMEVSSHALDQGRTLGTYFRGAGFTNLTQDHLDYHKDMESYFAAKSRLFTFDYSSKAFINIDDPYGERLHRSVDIEVLSLSRKNRDSDWFLEVIDNGIITRDASTSLLIRGPQGILIPGSTTMIGEHNLDNILMAVATAFDSGVDPLVISRSISELSGAPGRLERVDVGQEFLALVDYAHTPDAVCRTLHALRSRIHGKIIAVLGCGGDRDPGKRPHMGRYLLDGSDMAVFTSDNPRSEDPQAIVREMTSGLHLRPRDHVILDRREAIMVAVSHAQPGDCVVILGKGHETGQEIAGIKYPFDDRYELAKAIEGRREHDCTAR